MTRRPHALDRVCAGLRAACVDLALTGGAWTLGPATRRFLMVTRHLGLDPEALPEADLLAAVEFARRPQGHVDCTIPMRLIRAAARAYLAQRSDTPPPAA